MTKLKRKIRTFVLPAVILLLACVSQTHSQDEIDRVSMRFAQPQFNVNERAYSINVEMHALQPGQKLFGINLRFFYDATNIEFAGISALHSSYSIMGAAPFAYRGNDESGQYMFNFPASAAYINTAVQLMNEDAPLELLHTGWTKIATLNFVIPESVEINSQLCPALIWDQKSSVLKESFLPGSNGVVVTLVEEDASTRETTKPTVVTSESFNWGSYGVMNMPFGAPLQQDCAPAVVVSSVSDPRTGKGYQLYQNFPNPFSEETVIEFDLPEARQARLIFSDINGQVLYTLKGEYAAGRNAVRIDRRTWGVQGAMLFYRLESGDFISRALKMTLTDR